MVCVYPLVRPIEFEPSSFVVSSFVVGLKSVCVPVHSARALPLIQQAWEETKERTLYEQGDANDR